jgi:cytochrome c-type biogenesis protein CcmH
VTRALAVCALVLCAAAPLRAQTPAASAAAWPSAAELSGSDPRVVLGAPAGQGLHGSALEAGTKDVASLLRCPVCQGLSVADSPSTTAQNMRHQVRALLEQGYDKQQILAYFENSYGEFVRLQPPLRGINWLLWLAPAVVLLGGGAVLVSRARARAAEAEAAAAVTVPPDPALDAYRARARALAFGETAEPTEPR